MDGIKRVKSHKMLFVGVTTAQSIINYIFPVWMKILGSNVVLKGIDIPARRRGESVNKYADIYRDCIQKIKLSPDVLGAIVTTHKVGIYNTTVDLFDELVDSSVKVGAIGCVYKSATKLVGEATDVLAVKKAFENICLLHQGVPMTSFDVCILGCGGGGIALAYVLLANNDQFTGNVIMTDISDERIENTKNLLKKYDSNHKLRLHVIENTSETDKIINSLNTGSFVVNATGMGKDTPGSPVSAHVIFPNNGCIWEYNYRGELDFYKLATTQKITQNLSIFDGFDYFLHEWITAISRILGICIDDELFERLSKAATGIYVSKNRVVS